MKRVVHVVGARPNFIKADPVFRAIEATGGVAQKLVHTGQHFDDNMSHVFFRELELREPDVNLGIGSGSQTTQTARAMQAIDDWLEEEPCDLLLVYGDVNSTLAASLVAAKRGIELAHVEAGLRSFDRTMPEEVNRIVTDRLSDMLFTPSEDADRNLLDEGRDPSDIYRVGNVMIDTLMRLRGAAEARYASTWSEKVRGSFILVTLHRPSNVDDPDTLDEILNQLETVADRVQVLFPMHPRTRKLSRSLERVSVLDPLPYLDFLALEMQAAGVITDSGGVQEETTVLDVPCMTLRPNTERPITVEIGSNVLLHEGPSQLAEHVDRVLSGHWKRSEVPPLWDGRAGERIAGIVSG